MALSCLMDAEKYKTLKANYSTVVDNLNLDGLLDKMIDRNILSLRQKVRIDVIANPFDKISTLLDNYIFKFDDQQYDEFCYLIRDTQPVLLNCLLPDTPDFHKTIEHGVPRPTEQETLVPSSNQDSDSDSEYDPSNIQVKPSTTEFYLKHKKNAYEMYGERRGKALIINVKCIAGQPRRDGTDVDRDCLKNLWEKLNFQPVIYNDEDGLQAKEIGAKVAMFAEDSSISPALASVVCILTHGTHGKRRCDVTSKVTTGDFLYGTDGKLVSLNHILHCFNNRNSQHLQGRPKMFFIQACRGDEVDDGVIFEDVVPDGSVQKPTYSDYIIGQPTQAGFRAWRNQTTGSWYIQILVEVISRYAHKHDLHVMLNRVNRVIAAKQSRSWLEAENCKSQMSTYQSSLQMDKLYFFPGILQDYC